MTDMVKIDSVRDRRGKRGLKYPSYRVIRYDITCGNISVYKQSQSSGEASLPSVTIPGCEIETRPGSETRRRT